MIVTDANVVAYAFIKGPLTPAADAVFLKDPQWTAPPLWRDEVLNTLTNYVRAGQLTMDAAVQAISYAMRRMRTASQALDAREVLNLAIASRCSAYDTQYVVLAQALGLKLVTEDRQVLAAFPGVAVSMQQFVGGP